MAGVKLDIVEFVCLCMEMTAAVLFVISIFDLCVDE